MPMRSTRPSRTIPRLFVPCLALLIALGGLSPGAGAAELRVRLYNLTRIAIDYSLQMAYVDGDDLLNRVSIGKEYIEDLGDQPELMPGELSYAVPYITMPRYSGGDDAISLNMRMRMEPPSGTISYENYGMLPKIFARLHHCDLHRYITTNDGEIILLVLTRSSPYPFTLSEILPNGDSCTFNLTREFGEEIWSRNNALATPDRGDAFAPGASRPRAELPISGEELAARDPALREQLDAAYLEATGIDLREVRARAAERARNPALRVHGQLKTP